MICSWVRVSTRFLSRDVDGCLTAIVLSTLGPLGGTLERAPEGCSVTGCSTVFSARTLGWVDAQQGR